VDPVDVKVTWAINRGSTVDPVDVKGEWAINRGSTVDPVDVKVSGLLIEVALWIQWMSR
jgi:hypothetical protein